MVEFAVRRLLQAIPTLLVIATVTFFLIRIAPGGPFDSDKNLPPEIQANLDRKYHLDEPLWVQFGLYLKALLHGDLGPSYHYRDYDVSELIVDGFAVSGALGVMAMALAIVAGVAAGVMAALGRNSVVDAMVMTAAMTGISIPNFVIAPVLLLVFAVFLGWLPAGGWDAGSWRHWLLPVVCLALPQIAYIARITRGSLLEVLAAPYIRAALAKGLPLRWVIMRHALKPALLPVLSYLGPATAGLITGSVVIEQIFSIPGVGRYFVLGALNRDYTLVMGVVIFYGVLIVALNFVVDVLYAMLDPRMRPRS